MYLSGLILGLFSMVIATFGLFVLILDFHKNGIIALVMAFLISPYGLPIAVFWLLGKVLDLKYTIQDWYMDNFCYSYSKKTSLKKAGLFIYLSLKLPLSSQVQDSVCLVKRISKELPPLQ